MNEMFVIILLICLSVSVNCDHSDEGKYIDLLPEAEKREFLQRVARRILEEVEPKQIKEAASLVLNDVKLDEASSYVSKLLNEEAADLKRRNMNARRNKTKGYSNSSLRDGNKQKETYNDLTLRKGPELLELEQGKFPRQKENTTNTAITGLEVGTQSTTNTTEETVTILSEKVLMDVIKTNDLPLIGIENITEISNVVTRTQVVTASSPIENQTKRNFRRNDEKIDIQITIENANDTKLPKIDQTKKPRHVVYEDNLNKSSSINANKINESIYSDIVSSTPNSIIQNENSIQDDTKLPKMRANEETVNILSKANLNNSIPVDANKFNESIFSDTAISTPKSVNPIENSIKNSINQAPTLTEGNKNQTIAEQQKPLRNDSDIRETAIENDELLDNSRRKEVNVIPEEDENYKEVNILPEEEVELVTQKNTHSTVIRDISEAMVTSLDTPEVTVTSIITSEGIVTRADTEETIALDKTVSGTEPVNTTIDKSALTVNKFTANATTGLYFRASDIIWPQAENYSLVRVFDTAVAVNGTEVTTTTEENRIASTTEVKLISVMSIKPQKKNIENPNGQKPLRKSMKSANNVTLAPDTSNTKLKYQSMENMPHIHADYPIFLRRHASLNTVGEYPSINEEIFLQNVTQEPDSELTYADTKSTTQEFPNASLKKDHVHSDINRENNLGGVTKKLDLELTHNDTKTTSKESPNFLRGNDTILKTPASESELIYQSSQVITSTTKLEPQHSFESVTQIRTTRDLDPLKSENADDLTSNMENIKVELIKKKKKAHKANIGSVTTSKTMVTFESVLASNAQTTSSKALTSENDYPLVRAQEDDTETKTPNGAITNISTISPNEAWVPLQGSIGEANSELTRNISDDNQETITEVQLTSVVSTEIKSSNANSSNDSVHIERRIGMYDSIDSEQPTTESNTEEKVSTISETAFDFITTEFVNEMTSQRNIGLLSDITSEIAKMSSSKQANESASIPAYESTSKNTDESVSELLNEPTTKSSVKAYSEVNNDTISEIVNETLSDRDSWLTTEPPAESATEIYSTFASERNNEKTSKSLSDLASVGNSHLASESRNDATSKLMNELASEPTTEVTTKTSSEAINNTSSQSQNDFASKLDNELTTRPSKEITSKSVNESTNEPISESMLDNKFDGKLSNVTTSKPVSDIANEPIRELITIETTPQSTFELQYEVQQSTKIKNKANELKEDTTPFLSTSSTSNQNAQIEKPVDESKHSVKFIYVTTENTVEDTTLAEIQKTTTTADNGDIEVKTKKLYVESTSRNYDSREIMTKVPRVAEIYAPNIAKSNIHNKSEQVQNQTLSLQLGLVPQEPVTEKIFESLIKFHTTKVMKEYSVYEIPANEEPFKKINTLLTKKPTQNNVKDVNYHNKESYFVPVHDYGSEQAYYNPQTRVKPYKEDLLVNFARNNEKRGNVERIPIYDYSAKNAYFNPYNHLGLDPGEEFAARSNFVREVDENEPVEISEAELQRILREEDEVPREEIARTDTTGRSNVDDRNEPYEISESELKRILREDELPSEDELQAIIKQSGSTKDEIIEALRKDSKSKDVLRFDDSNSFVFPPNAKSQSLRITPLDIKQILDDNVENSFTKPASRETFAANKIYSAPHKLDVDLQKLIQKDTPQLKRIIMSRGGEDSVKISDRMSKYSNIRKSSRHKRLFYPNKIVLDLQALVDDPKFVNILKARSNDRDSGEPDDDVIDNKRKSTPKKFNYLFRSILSGKTGISDVLGKAPIQKVSTDYFDFDYYFGRREQGRTDFKKFSNNDDETKILRGRHKEMSFDFPDSNEASHPYNSLKKKRYGSHSKLVKEYMISGNYFKNGKYFTNNTDPDLTRIEDRLKEYENKKTSPKKDDKKKIDEKNEGKKKKKNDEKKDEKEDEKKDEDKKDDVKEEENKYEENVDKENKDEEKQDKEKKDEEKKDEEKKDEEKKEEEKKDEEKQDKEKKDEEKKDEEKKDEEKKDEEKKDEEKKDEEKKDEEKKDKEKKEEEKKDEEKKHDENRAKLRTNDFIKYVFAVPQSSKALKYLTLEDLEKLLDNTVSSRVSRTKTLLSSFTKNEAKEKRILREEINVSEELDRIFHPNKTLNLEGIKLIMDHSDTVDIYDTLKKINRLYVRSRGEMFDVESYITVMNDMISTDNKALVQYDWLTTTVEIRSALKKMMDLIESYSKQEAINPYDFQLVKYLLYLYQTTPQRPSIPKANELTRRRGGRGYSNLRNFGADRGILPKSYRNIRKHKVHSLWKACEVPNPHWANGNVANYGLNLFLTDGTFSDCS